MTQLTLPRQLIGFAAWLGLCFVTSALGAIASIQAKTFYGQLSQPEWAPAAWVFGPVWTSLFIMMAIAAWLVWRQQGGQHRVQALTLFVIQLAINALWSWLFFAWQLGMFAFIDIVILVALLALTIISFWREQRLAALLLVPYLLWVTFAAGLNYSLWQLNPQLLG
ncbi:TspO/MBR family protein [Shewanella sp. NIFS-20-20]|uniref:TspO/MBR family protein n=1 Tax=Shewanella sp. NIFS-20-20 TaxID=2853806 RepID=UPI001C46237C|nr:TspO/MBR family protein [Shewanella sp. NIFS-20-20]MBV7316583.1 tryptophan-rich sensory protein [Shewanella sp. NIFS-20-20]